MAKSARTSKCTALLVAAIDFGTTFSGYAFSFRHDYESDKMNIYSDITWISSGASLASSKTPTTLLLNPDYTFNSFGYEAEEEYNDLIDNDEHWDYHYFKRFKMHLHNQTTINRDMTIQDSSGVPYSAKKVFTHSIAYLKEHLLHSLEKKKLNIQGRDIQWVLTVPAIWNEAGKQFMREAAEEAGIDKHQLILALEPEAASLFCKHSRLERSEPEGGNIVPFRVGTKYMILDLGGGTVDVTVHEVLDEDLLKELHLASGGAWGGTKIDEAYIDLLKSVFGPNVIEEFQSERRTEHLEFLRDFELKKRTIKDASGGKQRPTIVAIPSTLAEIYTKRTNNDISKALSDHGDDLRWRPGNKLSISRAKMESMFEITKSNIIEHIHNVLSEPSARDVSALLMVGGFSNCNIIASTVEKEFPNIKVIIPSDPGLAVVKGAVLYGHDPLTIASRICKFTYGIATEATFIPGKHPEKKRVEKNGEVLCTDLFSKFVRRGNSVEVDQVISNTYYATKPNSPMMIKIFASDEYDPMLTTDCTKLGSVQVQPPEGGWRENAPILVQMKFGGTEFEVSAVDADNPNNIYTVTFDFLH